MRRALCVGIDRYSSPLIGCVNDATALGDILAKHDDNSPNFEIRSMLAPIGGPADAVTLPKLRKGLDHLFEHPADAALFFFSGHGTENNLGGFLVTQDATQYAEGLPMQELIDRANQSRVGEIVLMLDCCFSGNLGNPPALDNVKSLLREGVSILTSSRGNQVSVVSGGQSLFTSLVLDALDGGAADVLGNVTASSIYGYVQGALGAWDQRPLFKSHVSKLVAIRKCHSAVEIETLRELPVLFPLPAEDLALAPKYEKTHPEYEVSFGVIFEKLQALCRAHLVMPNSFPHMYDAAVNSASCRLTASGRYYWRLSKNGMI